MSLFKEKLNKQLVTVLHENGILEPKTIQQKTIARINGGADLIGIGPDGSGKSTTVVMSVVHRLREAFEDAPRTVVLCGDVNKAEALFQEFVRLSRHTDLRIRLAHEGGKIDKQGEEIYMGADVVVGTPKRLFDLYLKQNLNLNQLKIFVIDDAELMVKYQYQSQIDRMIQSLPRCQRLVFTNDFNPKVEVLVSKILFNPAIIEVEE